jgi:glycosyltransferase involved in cell wall biosynthesis
MRIAFLAAGAGGGYCGSCLHDNALALAMRRLGKDFLLVPAYTPLRVEGEDASEPRIFLGALEVYFAEMAPRAARLLGPVLRSRALIRLVSRFAARTDPRGLGRLTVSVLRGEEGRQRQAIAELADWLAGSIKPDVIHLSNLLFAGLASGLKRAVGVPVVAGLQGEDLFVESLPEPYRSEAVGLLRERAADIAAFVSTNRYYADHAAEWLGLDRSRLAVVPNGIASEDFAAGEPRAAGTGPLAIGYFARIAPEKGLELLADAYAFLAQTGEFPGLRLRVAGYLPPAEHRYAARVRAFLAARGLGDRVEILGTVDRAAKVAFLRGIDVFAVPAVHPEPKGISVLEALASGVPVVQPAHGSYPEIIEATGGGLLHAPRDPQDLAAKLATLLRDPDLRRLLGDAGRAAVRERFTAEKMAEGHLAVYERVAGKPVAPAGV